jgi:DNA processing protein
VGLEAWLPLLLAAGSGDRRWLTALAAHGSPEALLARSRHALVSDGLPEDGVDKLKSPDPAALRRAHSWLAAPNHHLVTLGSAQYPPLLANIVDPPLALWVDGPNPSHLSNAQLAMVGSRNPTTGGRETAEQFARYLAERGLMITSGLAIGIDGASHRGAVGEIGGTIAVLGSGPDVLYPRAHAALAREIAERWLLVSEYAPGVEPHKLHFPKRNRIIAGLTLGTLVVEATLRSGSLITAKLASDEGREVFAIPGSIHNPLARGCHRLIRDGAKLVEQAADVVVELAPQLKIDLATLPAPRSRAPDRSSPIEDPEYRKVLESMGFQPRSITDLIAVSGLTAAELSSMLLVLELEGLVEALPGGRYSRLASERMGKRD